METQDDHSWLEPRLANTDDLVSLEASKEVTVTEIAGVKIPFANPQLLWKTKQTHREKDALDRTFLAELLKKKGTNHDDPTPSA